jgi:ectoine hydroxylase-related dioxygenase (phytanoyl-CoA dioxygenase family)
MNALPQLTQPLSTLDTLRSQGYVILEDLADPATIDTVCRELEPWIVATPLAQGDVYGWNTTRLGAVLLKSRASHALVAHETILSIMDDVLGPNCDWYQLNLSQAVRIHPGERRQVPHRDEEMWPCPKYGMEYLVNVMWTLSDFTEGNGATCVWPRSQFSGLDRNGVPARAVDFDSRVVATAPRGSAIVYLGSVTHCAGANRSNKPRTGLLLSYCLGWLKQYENAFLTYPPQVARHFSRQIRDLLGYRIHRPNLGGYEGEDPAVLFTGRSHRGDKQGYPPRFFSTRSNNGEGSQG